MGLKIENVSKSYGRKKVVDNISINIDKPEVFGLLGTNGAGKTTTIRMLLGILKKEESEMLAKTHERTFLLGIEKYNEQMQWINEFMRSKGMQEDIFTELNNYYISSDDYDYYYEFKTPTQYKKDEEKRKAKKFAKEGKTLENQLPEEPNL